MYSLYFKNNKVICNKSTDKIKPKTTKSKKLNYKFKKSMYTHIHT